MTLVVKSYPQLSMVSNSCTKWTLQLNFYNYLCKRINLTISYYMQVEKYLWHQTEYGT